VVNVVVVDMEMEAKSMKSKSNCVSVCVVNNKWMNKLDYIDCSNRQPQPKRVLTIQNIM
jgi:hypothetical protein